MLTPPDGLPEAALAAALGRWWGMSVASAEYRPVGWGSHHWAVTDTAGSQWFITADELEHKRVSERPPRVCMPAALPSSWRRSVPATVSPWCG
jgi:spectinomycin phosphotransferase/16S rRNA (guanine(1405)-N(7))-methyltransferase